MLSEKGVPDEKLMDRLNGFASKVPLERLQSVEDADNEGLWNTVKSMASEVRYRLITPAELKIHQQNQRKAKGKGKSKSSEEMQFIGGKSKGKGKGGNKGKGKQPVQISELVIDTQHFSTDNGNVQKLELTRFGADQTGLRIVSAEEAKQCLRTATKSCEPLALLIVGNHEHIKEFGEVYSIPAHGPNGVPLVVQACLLQFGDTPVYFNMKVPNVTVLAEASTTIEFCIMKEHVPKWADTQIPLHYVGVHVSALRGSNLQGVWAIQSCDEKRKPVSHKVAHHWHGFFRVSDVLLESVLARSGAAGIFFVPKTPDHKHDQRYAVVNLPSKSLSDVMTKASQCEHALGIVRMGEGYGIRAKREHIAAVRNTLLPETAYVEFANVNQDEMLYIISHVPQVTREDLDQILAKAGWDAHAIRPQGTHRWTVASKHEPQVAHMVINGYMATIEKQANKVMHTNAVSLVAREVKVDTVVDPVTKVVSTTSRYAEIQAHMQTQIEQVIENKLQMANHKIAQLTDALADMQENQTKVQNQVASDMNQLRDEQQFARQKMQEVENSIAASGTAIITQMGQMLATMQSSLEQTMAQKFDTDKIDKRARTEEPAKADPFATKS